MVREGIDGRPVAWQQANLQGKHVIAQAARERMLIEVLPPNFGDWQGRIVEHTAGWGHGNKQHMAGSFIGLIQSERITQATVNTANIGGDPKMKQARVIDFHLLNGGSEAPGPVRRGIYRKGETILIDNMMMQGSEIWHDWLVPGRFVAAHARRSRWTPDMFAITSDIPVAWGVIESITGDTVVLRTPEGVGIPETNSQSIILDAEVDVRFLGQEVHRRQVLREGTLMRVYPARPQTLLVASQR